MSQTNNFGFNPGEVAQLASFAALVQQIGPTLGLPEAEQQELNVGARELAMKAASDPKDQGKLRRAADRVTSALGSATQVTGALTLLVEAGHKGYSAVFGG